MRPHVMGLQLRDHLLRQLPHLVMQRAVAELQIVIRHQVLDVFHGKRHTHRDADSAHGQKFDDALNPHRPPRPEAFKWRQPYHLRLVEEKLARTALARVHDELRHRLTEQYVHRLPRHVVSHVEGVNVNHLAGVTRDFGGLWLGED